jgi:hypothetical protein
MALAGSPPRPTSSAANLTTAAKGAASGTLTLRTQVPWASRSLSGRPAGRNTHTRNGSLGSDARMILKVTLFPPLAALRAHRWVSGEKN